MNDQNTTAQFAGATEITPITQKNNVKRLFPHRGSDGVQRNLDSAIDDQKRSANQRRMDWVLAPVIEKDVRNGDIPEPGERGQAAAQENRHLLPLAE